MTNLSNSQSGTSESGHLPGRYEWVAEPSPGGVPTDPEWNRFSDAVRTFEMEPGSTIGRQDAVGTPDAVDHNRGVEEPEGTVGYDLQRFPVDGSGDPIDASAYGIERDAYNGLLGTLLAVGRREYGGGNDDAGVREYSVIRGAGVDTVEPELDPSSEQPILMELGLVCRKARSYKIHQPSASTTLDIVSTNSNDTMDITIENEDAGTTETIALTGTTTVTTTTSFGDIDAVWLSDNPEGDITVSDGSGTTIMEIDGGLTYSDDSQPVDGDRGVPPLGSGSHASAIGGSYEHFVGDRFERPAGSAVRARVNSASWAIENDINTQALHDTRAPALDAGNRTVTVDADAGGPFASHDSMMESLQLNQANLEHELGGGTITFKNATPQDAATRTIEAEQAVTSISETFGCSGDPPITLSAN